MTTQKQKKRISTKPYRFKITINNNLFIASSPSTTWFLKASPLSFTNQILLSKPNSRFFFYFLYLPFSNIYSDHLQIQSFSNLRLVPFTKQNPKSAANNGVSPTAFKSRTLVIRQVELSLRKIQLPNSLSFFCFTVSFKVYHKTYIFTKAHRMYKVRNRAKYFYL